MKIKLINYTPLSVCASAIRECWGSQDKGECYPTPTDNLADADRNLIERVVNKHKHSSTAEHLTYNFSIEGISRALLQELARHRIASLSVKSTRYTLKELKHEQPFTSYTDSDSQEYLDSGRSRAERYLVMTDNEQVNRMSILALDNLRDLVHAGISNDVAKYAIPEAYKTSLAWSINARSLQNFLTLRINHRHALWEIVKLAENIALALPNDHKYLYKDAIDEFASPEFKEVFSKSMV